MKYFTLLLRLNPSHFTMSSLNNENALRNLVQFYCWMFMISYLMLRWILKARKEGQSQGFKGWKSFIRCQIKCEKLAQRV